ncbi:prolyl 3-hydroxylase 1-like [Branchiostoma lanceolatum]|uniref:prolyl 3-hydroxylase 1-like n=1 Tax=Branchiostoma lanceolatum TaxID=7740 RepID=UPI00345621F3
MTSSVCLVMVYIAVWLASAANTAQTPSDVVSDVTVAMGPEALLGEKRVLAEGLATQGECDMMLDLAQVGVMPGEDGPFVYTDYESFEGMEVIQVAKLAQQGVVSVDSADKFLTLSEKARRFVHDYFGLQQELFFEYTHLVCRTAVTDSGSGRPQVDPSHKVHVDRCLLSYIDWSCSYQPELDQRHYSAVMFLNDDFKGGEFFFAHNATHNAQATVQPKCGRLVAFSSGPENPHGVQAVLQGRRCVLAMWYTLDKQHDELSRYEAREMVDTLLKPEGDQTNEKLKNEL